MIIRPIGDRILVTSRGVKEDAGAVVVPGRYLRDSNICTTQSGQRVIIRDLSAHELGDREKIISAKDLLAAEVDGEWRPMGTNVIVRKCIDPDEGEIITSLSKRKTRFAEVVAAGPDSVLKDRIGWLAHVEDMVSHPQKVEDTEDDWITNDDSILMVVKTEE
jgi:co-chaperonin GroES (HSP10)